MTQIIGFVAPKGSGKTTACNIIKKHLPDVVQINFKDALIEEIKENFPDLLREIQQQTQWFDGWKYPDPITLDDLFFIKPPLVRTLLQNYGTNVRRVDDVNYWVTQWMRKVCFKQDNDNHWIFTGPIGNILTDDVRFKNEAQIIKTYNGILIRLERTDLEQTDTHQSETEQKEIECDYTITCGAGELDKLEAELIKILDSVE